MIMVLGSCLLLHLRGSAGCLLAKRGMQSRSGQPVRSSDLTIFRRVTAESLGAMRYHASGQNHSPGSRMHPCSQPFQAVLSTMAGQVSISAAVSYSC